MEYESFRKRLIAYRKKKGYTQQQLADILEISNKTISRWETGEGYPDITILVPLCDALGISCDQLLRDHHSYKDLQNDDIQKYMPFFVVIAGFLGYYITARLNLPILISLIIMIASDFYALHLETLRTDKKLLPNLIRFVSILSFFPLYSVLTMLALIILLSYSYNFNIFAVLIFGGTISEEMNGGYNVMFPFIMIGCIAALVSVLLYFSLKRYYRKRYDIAWTPLIKPCGPQEEKKSQKIATILTFITVLIFFGGLYYVYQKFMSPQVVYNYVTQSNPIEYALTGYKYVLFLLLLPALIYNIYGIIRHTKYYVYLRNLAILVIYLGGILWLSYMDTYYVTAPRWLLIGGGIVIVIELVLEFLMKRKQKKED